MYLAHGNESEAFLIEKGYKGNGIRGERSCIDTHGQAVWNKWKIVLVYKSYLNGCLIV
jgi:hypothetical protein